MQAQPTGTGRRSSRVLWRTSLIVIWVGQGGLKVRQHAETEIVNAHGALLRLDAPLQSGRQIDLLDPRTNECKSARVVWSQQESGGPARAGVELSMPSETFWGLYIPVQGPARGTP